jgi:hypothetical protein
LSGSSISRQGRLFIPRSSLRPLSGRIAHHPKLPPRSISFHSLGPANSAGRHRANQGNPPALPSALDAPPWTTDRSPWRDRGRGASTIRPGPDGTTRCPRAVTYGIDQGVHVAMSASAYCVGTAAVGCWTRNWQQSEAGYGARSRSQRDLARQRTGRR